MLDLIRSYQQTQPNDTFTREISLHRSGSFLYLMSLVGNKEAGVWTGELGLLYRNTAGNLLKKLGRLNATQQNFPLVVEAEIEPGFGALVERIGYKSDLRKSHCTDLGTVTLYMANPSMLQQFASELESALAWAA